MLRLTQLLCLLLALFLCQLTVQAVTTPPAKVALVQPTQAATSTTVKPKTKQQQAPPQQQPAPWKQGKDAKVSFLQKYLKWSFTQMPSACSHWRRDRVAWVSIVSTTTRRRRSVKPLNTAAAGETIIAGASNRPARRPVWARSDESIVSDSPFTLPPTPLPFPSVINE